MKPRQHECGCYLADHLRECPKCGKKVKPRTEESDAAEQAAEEMERLAKLNSRAKILDGSKLRWAISKFGYDAHKMRLQELRRRSKHGDKTVTAEMKLCERIVNQSRAGRWSTMAPPKRFNDDGRVIITKGPLPVIVISPKGHQYVRCHANEYADLIIDYTKDSRRSWIGQYRLRRWEKSSYYKIAKKDELDAQSMKARKQAKRDRKKAKKKLLKKLKTAA